MMFVVDDGSGDDDNDDRLDDDDDAINAENVCDDADNDDARQVI